MQEHLTTDERYELVKLWQRRRKLGSADIGRMYYLVETALKDSNPPELNALGEGRQELIGEFIFTKVLKLGSDQVIDAEGLSNETATESEHSAPSTTFAVCAYFRRYLIDCTRASSFKRKVSLDDESQENDLLQRTDDKETLEGVLNEFGLTAQKVSVSAKQFISALDEPERILLREGFGSDQAGGLSGVASRHSIASYHYRAGRLGLVHKRERLPKEYGKTHLGIWIERNLGIPIHPENMTVILCVFKILGVEASYA
jgi:hypothetical protein